MECRKDPLRPHGRSKRAKQHWTSHGSAPAPPCPAPVAFRGHAGCGQAPPTCAGQRRSDMVPFNSVTPAPCAPPEGPAQSVRHWPRGFTGGRRRSTRAAGGAVGTRVERAHRRSAWTCPEAAEAASIPSRRTRANVRALHAAGLLDQVSQAVAGEAAAWRVAAEARGYPAPITMVAPGGGRILHGKVG